MPSSFSSLKRLGFDTSEGKVDAELLVEMEESPFPCDVCRGMRFSLWRTLISIKFLEFCAPNGTRHAPSDFKLIHGHLFKEIHQQLQQRGFGHVICFTCQEDLLLPGEWVLQRKGEDDESTSE